MSIDTPAIPPEGEPKKNYNWLWGCLIALVLIIVVFCCGVTLIFLPLFSNSDPLGTGLRDQIENFLPMEYLEDPSSIPGYEDFVEDDFLEDLDDFDFNDSDQAWDIELAQFYYYDIGTSFVYPVGWDVEVDNFGVTFYDPDSYTYMYIGEDMVESGTRAEDISLDVMDSVRESAEEGSFELISSSPYPVSFTEDAHLTHFEWVDLDGYSNWAYDLETASGESNIFLFLSGENPDDIEFYGDLLETITDSMDTLLEVDETEDA